MPSPQSIDLKVRILRSGLKASDIAKLLGVSNATVSLAINGARSNAASLNHLREIERVLASVETHAARRTVKRRVA